VPRDVEKPVHAIEGRDVGPSASKKELLFGRASVGDRRQVTLPSERCRKPMIPRSPAMPLENTRNRAEIAADDNLLGTG
jgi:hypothetical protein